MKSGGSVAWLTCQQAAVYLGYVHPDGTPNMNAFYLWKRRAQPKAHRLRGAGLRFRQTDLDRCLDPERYADSESEPLRVVGGRG